MRALSLTFIGLLVLLLLTIWASLLELGPVTLLISMTISLAKTLLILIFFMHLRRASPLLKILACSGFVWLAVLFTLTFDDYTYRPRDVESPHQPSEARPLPSE